MSRRKRRQEYPSGQIVTSERAEMRGGATRGREARFKAGIAGLMAPLLEALPMVVSERDGPLTMSQLAEALRALAVLLYRAAGVKQAEDRSLPARRVGSAPQVPPQVRLSAPQVAIFRLLDAGFKPQEIAKQLAFAVSTVYWRLGQVNKLLDTHSYAESLLIVRESGMIDDGRIGTQSLGNSPVN